MTITVSWARLQLLSIVLLCPFQGCAIYLKKPITVYDVDRATNDPLSVQLELKHGGEVINRPAPTMAVTNAEGVAYMKAANTGGLIPWLFVNGDLCMLNDVVLDGGGEAGTGAAPFRVFVAPGRYDAAHMRSMAFGDDQ